MHSINTRLFSALILTLLLSARSLLLAYPLDGFDDTDIPRLEGYYDSLQTLDGKMNFVPGQLVSMLETKLRLSGQDLELPVADPALSDKLRALTGRDSSNYAISLLDLSNPAQPVYAGLNDNKIFLPASTGKLLVAMAFFQELAEIYPKDFRARLRILRRTVLEADEYSQPDTHDVPIWHPDTRRIDFRPVVVGERGNIYTFLDWMLSSSSNAAGNTIMRELVLLRHFKAAYPPPAAEASRFLRSSSPARLAGLLRESIRNALRENDLDMSKLYHTSLFTSRGRELIPSDGSAATSREFLRLLLKLEEGRLVDPFSSIELKRLLLLTQTRIRFAAAPALDSAAVYFKSGSLSRCTPARQKYCRQFYGDAVNLMNSVAIVEYPAGEPRYHYLVVMSSNVLGKDSAAEHAQIAAGIQELIQTR